MIYVEEPEENPSRFWFNQVSGSVESRALILLAGCLQGILWGVTFGFFLLVHLEIELLLGCGGFYLKFQHSGG